MRAATLGAEQPPGQASGVGSQPPALGGGEVGEGDPRLRIFAPFAAGADGLNQREGRRTGRDEREIAGVDVEAERFVMERAPPPAGVRRGLMQDDVAPSAGDERARRRQPGCARSDDMDNRTFHGRPLGLLLHGPGLARRRLTNGS